MKHFLQIMNENHLDKILKQKKDPKKLGRVPQIQHKTLAYPCIWILT